MLSRSINRLDTLRTNVNTAVGRQKAVAAYLKSKQFLSKQLLPSGSQWQNSEITMYDW